MTRSVLLFSPLLPTRFSLFYSFLRFVSKRLCLNRRARSPLSSSVDLFRFVHVFLLRWTSSEGEDGAVHRAGKKEIRIATAQPVTLDCFISIRGRVKRRARAAIERAADQRAERCMRREREREKRARRPCYSRQHSWPARPMRPASVARGRRRVRRSAIPSRDNPSQSLTFQGSNRVKRSETGEHSTRAPLCAHPRADYARKKNISSTRRSSRFFSRLESSFSARLTSPL